MVQKIKINCVIGIDPGAAGGLAVYVPAPTFPLVRTQKMPKDLSELRDFFAYWAENYKPIAFLEKLSIRPDDIVVNGDKAAMGKLYRVQKMMANYEHLKALLETSGIPYVQVHPLSWQTKLNLRTRGVHEEKAERKNRYRLHAASCYQQIRVTLWNADALLLMHFGRWALVNDLQWVKSNLPEREYQKLF